MDRAKPLVTACSLLLATAGVAFAQKVPDASKVVFSRASIMARGVELGANPRSLIDKLDKEKPGQLNKLVAERIEELEKAGAIRTQIVKPDGEAKAGDYPWMVAFEAWHPIRRDWVQFCGGTIVAKQVVLSAAHCNNFPLEYIRVILQAVVLDKSSSIKEYRVSRIQTHPKFDRVDLKLPNGKILRGLVYDFALFHLSQDPSVMPVFLTSDSTKKDVISHGAGRAMGWGVTSAGKTSPTLLYVDVPIVDDGECGKSYSPLQSSMLCAGKKSGGADACQGDSGGPLLVKNKSGAFVQAGVISFGEGCGLPAFYGIYSSVTEGRQWIANQLSGKP